MKNSHFKRSWPITLGAVLFLTVGTYNAVIINSESSLSSHDMRFAKRLDEVYGVMVSKREVANSLSSQKISLRQSALEKLPSFEGQTKILSVTPSVNNVDSDAQDNSNQAAVKDELSLVLTQVSNPKKWQQGLKPSQFNGNLSTRDGVIENLVVSLPNGEGLSISFSEMTGNIFEYDFEGEVYSGMMYQDGQNSYVVTLTNGPLEGTRLSFTGELSLEEQYKQEEEQRSLAESNEALAGQQPLDDKRNEEETPVETQEVVESQPAVNPEQDLMAQEQGQLEQSNEGYVFNFEGQKAM